jgi:acetyl-CoA carboxylase biotin carboxyl carrier protein
MIEQSQPNQALDEDAVLDAVRLSLGKLLADLPRLPTALRIRSADVSVELEWAVSTEFVPAQPTAAAASAPVTPAPEETATPDAVALTAPTVGVFYRSPAPSVAPFVEVGDLVRAGQQIGIIEAMKLMIPVEAERAGLISAVLVADGTAVEFGESLFHLSATS